MTGGQIAWLSESDPPDAFPPVDLALREPDGLLAAGGDLGSARLLEAYRRGIFPWYEDGQPLLWWSPDPRCVFRPGDLHVSRRLRRELRGSHLDITFNTAFAEVVRACAAPRRYSDGTWITAAMTEAYCRLHDEGWAHSIEIRDGEALVGGLYGIAIGRAFFGESMFSGRPNTSKMALVQLDRLMADGRFGLVDCQLTSAHLLGLGATVMPRARFTQLVAELCEPPEPFDDWPEAPVAVRDLARN